MKLRLNFQLIVCISHVILSEYLLNEAKKMYSKEKHVTYKQDATKLFSILRLLLFSLIFTFEESLLKKACNVNVNVNI